jgi:hypothetical protein
MNHISCLAELVCVGGHGQSHEAIKTIADACCSGLLVNLYDHIYCLAGDLPANFVQFFTIIDRIKRAFGPQAGKKSSVIKNRDQAKHRQSVKLQTIERWLQSELRRLPEFGTEFG